MTTCATWIPFGAVLAGHALRDHAQPRLGGGEVRVAGLAAQAAGGAREDHRAAAQRDQPACGLATDQEAGEAADAPEVLELLRGQLRKSMTGCCRR